MTLPGAAYPLASSVFADQKGTSVPQDPLVASGPGCSEIPARAEASDAEPSTSQPGSGPGDHLRRLR